MRVIREGGGHTTLSDCVADKLSADLFKCGGLKRLVLAVSDHLRSRLTGRVVVGADCDGDLWGGGVVVLVKGVGDGGKCETSFSNA